MAEGRFDVGCQGKRRESRWAKAERQRVPAEGTVTNKTQALLR